MPKRVDSMFLYKIACYYYKDGLGQDEIAAREGLSKSQISRLLDKVRTQGIVQVKVLPPENFNCEELAEELKENLGLEKVVVSPVDINFTQDENHISNSIALTAAEYLSAVIKSTSIVGVGWGTTVYQTAVRMSYNQGNESLCFVPLVGSVGQHARCFQINTIIDRFSEKFKAKSMFINSPAFIENNESLLHFKLEKEKVSRVIEVWDKLETVIIGLGKPIDRSGYLKEEMESDIFNELMERGTVGDILGQFFDGKGNVLDMGDKYHLIGYDLKKLKEIKDVICLCGGEEKVDGIIAAARAGYMKTLITDSETARMVLEEV